VTDATTARQKRNRAFAAELLAPSSGLRDRVQTAEVGPDQVEELADEFGVSTEVVSLQLENHRIARVRVP
jgi:Zn-dependent peptidase ImmA (M78 family)